MFASVRSYTGIAPENFAKIVERVEDGFVPIVQGVPGFKQYCLITQAAGDLVTVSIFDSEASAAESSRRAAAWIKENIAGLIPNPPQVTEGELAVFVPGG